MFFSLKSPNSGDLSKYFLQKSAEKQIFRLYFRNSKKTGLSKGYAQRI